MFKLFKKANKEKNRKSDIIRFTVRNIITGEEETLEMDRIGYSNFMVYAYIDDLELVSSEVVKRA